MWNDYLIQRIGERRIPRAAPWSSGELLMLPVPRNRAFIPGGTPPQFDIGYQFGAYQHRPHGTPVSRYTWKSPWMKSGREGYCKRLRDWLTIWKIANPDTCVWRYIGYIQLPRGRASNQSSITNRILSPSKTRFILSSGFLNLVKFIRLIFLIVNDSIKARSGCG